SRRNEPYRMPQIADREADCSFAESNRAGETSNRPALRLARAAELRPDRGMSSSPADRGSRPPRRRVPAGSRLRFSFPKDRATGARCRAPGPKRLGAGIGIVRIECGSVPSPARLLAQPLALTW